MNDRYLFRAKGDKRYNDGEWYEGYLIRDSGGDYQIFNNGVRRTVDPSTICQCTGLKKFFEKDIVKRTDIHEVGEPSVGIIEYDVEDTAFVIHWIDKEIYSPLYSPMYPWKDKIKVIRNIFDNPELLEREGKIMERKKIELKPCPFCGKEATTSERENIEKMPHGWGWVGCRPCRVFINWSHGERGKKLAIEAWNRRTDDGLSGKE